MVSFCIGDPRCGSNFVQSTYKLHVISSYAISTAAISTPAVSIVHTFNRSHFKLLAFPTACKFNRRKHDLIN